MEGTVAIYLESRIKKMGYSSFTFKITAITVAVNTTYQIPNENNKFYLLFDVSNDVDNFSIKADNDTLTKSEFNFAGVPYVLHEFKGNVIINNPSTSANSITFLLIEVFPEVKKLK